MSKKREKLLSGMHELLAKTDMHECKAYSELLTEIVQSFIFCDARVNEHRSIKNLELSDEVLNDILNFKISDQLHSDICYYLDSDINED